MSAVIDAHHHLWRYDAREYDWIDDSMAALRRDFLAEDIEKTARSAGVDATVVVQARQTIEETQWLLQIAAEHPFIAGVVGWVPLTHPNVAASLEAFAANPKLLGVRHVLQGEADEYMLGTDFQRGVSLLRDFGLAYDVLIHERQLASAIQLVDEHPSQVFILDHIAKPLISAGKLQPWSRLISQLAERPNVYCKISAMVTEDNWQTWSRETLQPYFDVVLKAFGPRRLMYGSDWPVCLVAATYPEWIATVHNAIEGLSTEEQSWVMGRTAQQAYRLAGEN